MNGWKKIPQYLTIIVLSAFVLQVYPLSFSKSKHHVVSYANKAAYAAAQWIDLSRLKENPTILSYTDNNMMMYYVNKKEIETRNIRWLEFTVPMRYQGEPDREPYKQLFFNLLKEHRVDYIIFDNYVVQKPEFLGVNDVKRLLFEERENPAYFTLKNLFYKKQNVGYVLRPVFKPGPLTDDRGAGDPRVEKR
jgi:hypothetical protein